jgi:O-antigen ligase
MLIHGEAVGWTNLTPDLVWEMKRDNVIITTNGLDVANPAILAKFAKGRVSGTLVYPNALAGLVLLLFPVSLVLAFNSSTRLRPVIRLLLILMVLFLGLAGFFWTGSKLGWLIALGAGIAFLFRLKWPPQYKWTVVILVVVLGLGIFAIRFHHYFAAGATSLGARFDYWHAAVQTTLAHPGFGTGPGTFQRPYAELKSPDSEMARLTHNDYLQQFSDSGMIGGIFYSIWILTALTVITRKVWHSSSPVIFALFLGIVGWFAQGIGEFELYIPALAWTAFTLLGSLINQIDMPKTLN